ncbi:MAG: DUF3857 and transglutaminase domain-containing protein [Candidatus Stahlbacteria bacterium]|nr:DUF3857 and transglutaminase domain-containing protein [Candidatus Stahlbacteria bacterium]
MGKRLFFVGLIMFVFGMGCALKRNIISDNFFKLSVDTYPESHGVTVFDSVFVKCNLDGTGTERTHFLAKIFTTYGKKKYGEVKFNYFTNEDTVIIKFARSITADGKTVTVPKENITDNPMPAWKGSLFLIPNLRIVTITFTGLDIGGGIEYETERITHDASFDSTFDSWYMFEDNEPIETKYLEISLPKNMKPNYKIVNGQLQHEELDREDTRVYLWKAEHIPRILEEPAMPPIFDIATKLVITTRSSWEQGSQWYYNLCEPNLQADSSVKAEVKSITKDAKTFEDTVRTLYEFVNKKIRYVETDLLGKNGGYEPQTIGFTLQNKYGVCRDKAALLVGMLREAGIKNIYLYGTN